MKDVKMGKRMLPYEEVDLLERLASVTEELEDIVATSQQKKQKKPPIDVKAFMEHARKKLGNQIPVDIFSAFYILVLKNLMKGRMGTSAYMFGKNIGINSNVKSRKDILKVLRKFDVGRINIKECNLERVLVRLKGDITCMGVTKTTRPICYFEGGLLAGAIENFLNKKTDLVETKCTAKGDKYCQFELLSFKGRRIKKDVLPFLPIDSYSHENIRLLTMVASHAITSIENTLLLDRTRKEVEIDGLTRVYNHRYFQQSIRIEHKQSRQQKRPYSLLMVDLDNFKEYNDKFGHPKGDKVLKEAAAALVDGVRTVDIVSRYGGDEFAVILPSTNTKGALLVAERLRSKVSGCTFVGSRKKKNIHLKISIGITTYTGGPKTPEWVIKKADDALLKAKKKGVGIMLFSTHKGK